jgi:DNA polymerase III psi subunit
MMGDDEAARSKAVCAIFGYRPAPEISFCFRSEQGQRQREAGDRSVAEFTGLEGWSSKQPAQLATGHLRGGAMPHHVTPLLASNLQTSPFLVTNVFRSLQMTENPWCQDDMENLFCAAADACCWLWYGGAAANYANIYDTVIQQHCGSRSIVQFSRHHSYDDRLFSLS